MKFVYIFALCFALVSITYMFHQYSNPMMIPENYDCENHPGFIPSELGYYPFESEQNYVNRMNDLIKKQIEEGCS